MRTIHVCESCGTSFTGILHANNEVLSEIGSSALGCSASEEDDEITPTLCIECGADKWIV